LGVEERRKRERAMKRHAILEAARQLFLEKGFKTVTVENIAGQAEVSKGSIYLYFQSKEEIYTEILLEDIDKFFRKTNDLLGSSTSCGDSLIQFSLVYIDFFLKERELFRILMNFMLHTEDMNLPEDLNKHLIRATNRNMKFLEEIIQAGITAGEFSSDLDILKCRNTLWGFLNGVMSLHLFIGRESLRAERISSTVKEGLAVFIRGLKERGTPVITDH